MNHLKQARLSYKGMTDEWLYRRISLELKDKVSTIHELLEEIEQHQAEIKRLKKNYKKIKFNKFKFKRNKKRGY